MLGKSKIFKKSGLKTLVLLLAMTLILVLSACGSDVVEEISHNVSFYNSDGSVTIEAVVDGENAEVPGTPTKEGYAFEYWYTTDVEVEFNFSNPITEDISLYISWVEVVIEVTDEDLINLDIDYYEENQYISERLLDMPSRGEVNRSDIEWEITSKYISEEGVILPLPELASETVVQIEATFTLNGTSIVKVYDVPLTHLGDVIIENSVSLPFENLTTEYVVEDGNIDIYFEENGSVPYVKIVDFFELLDGFIDPDAGLVFVSADGVLTISYDYYDEDEDELYNMEVTLDSVENTIFANDLGFYWAYVYSTETNYGRHITYDTDNIDASYDEGEEVIYDLDDYNMDIVMYEDELLLPFYMANQLFAGLSYYNVYYNTDSLYGIYSLPDSSSKEMRTIRSSSVSGDDLPVDLLIHTFNMLAFDLDKLYGLKDIMEIDSYYELLYSEKDDLLVLDPEDFDLAIRDLLLQSLDEPHTSYGYASYFNKTTWDGPETNSLSFYGSRFVQWYYSGMVAVDDAIEEKWGRGNISSTAWASTSNLRPSYWFLNSTSAVLSLDDFHTADIDESAVYDQTYVDDILESTYFGNVLPVITEGNKFFYYNSSTEDINNLEILIKGASLSSVSTYEAALVAAGFTYEYEANDNEDKQNGYYTITVATDDPLVPTIDFMVQVTFDEDYDLFYVGISNKVPTEYLDGWSLTIDIDNSVNSDSAVYFELMLDQILAESPGLQNITLDLSWNTGGNVGALYRIVGFITDEPFRVSSIDGDTGGYSSYYVDIDGIVAYDNLNWSLLITPVTFSAANSMATIFMENDLGVIMGITSGGGACSITPILLPNGTAFTMSSNNISAYRTGAGTEEDPYVYHNNEFGITPDFEIDIDYLYDTQTLLEGINSN